MNFKKKFADISVVVVGADHQNTLGILRACGMVGCRTYLIVHTNDKNKLIRCSKSRFLDALVDVVAENEDELVSALLTMKEISRATLIPTSDFAALCIDKHLDVLKDRFFLSTISNMQGEIAKNMDKYYQNEMLSKAGFKVARTVKLKLNDITSSNQFVEFNYPIVLKPIVSAYGAKNDIVIVRKPEDFLINITVLREKGYDEILAQEFIHKEYELVCFGAITPKTQSIYYGTLKKVRFYPYDGGASLSYAEYVDADELVLPVIKHLANLGYNGLFDIELFYVNGEVYINEINYRNSGNTWAIVKRGVNAPMAWVAEALGIPFDTSKKLTAKGSFMNETSDLHYVLDRKISIFRWIKDLMRVKAFNKFWSKDIRGSLIWYKRN